MSNILERYLSAYRNKITNKLFGVVSVPHQGKKKGVVLLSFLTGPFTHTPAEYFTDPHSNNWVAPEIARLFSERGYNVDIINWDNKNFIPRKKYKVCIDLNHNLKRLSPFLETNCSKIMFITGSYHQFQNTAEQKRIDDLNKRRGVKLTLNRTVPPSENLYYADFVVGYGNKTVRNTYPDFSEKIIPIPIPTMETYNFPENKNFETAKKNFLWFGGGGAILKGLDLVVETFATLPNLNLDIVGPSAYEAEFEKLYANELKLPNITRYGRPQFDSKNGESKIDGRSVYEIMNKSACVIGLSASEGGCGAVVQAMQAGLFPIITPQSGIDELAPSIVIDNPTIENIRKTVENFSNLPAEKVGALAQGAWAFSRAHHTKESFTKVFGTFMDTKLKL